MFCPFLLQQLESPPRSVRSILLSRSDCRLGGDGSPTNAVVKPLRPSTAVTCICTPTVPTTTEPGSPPLWLSMPHSLKPYIPTASHLSCCHLSVLSGHGHQRPPPRRHMLLLPHPHPLIRPALLPQPTQRLAACPTATHGHMRKGGQAVNTRDKTTWILSSKHPVVCWPQHDVPALQSSR